MRGLYYITHFLAVNKGILMQQRYKRPLLTEKIDIEETLSISYNENPSTSYNQQPL